MEYMESVFGPTTDELGCSIEDHRFDQVFPERVRQLSSVYWTPVAVAACAAKLLVNRRVRRVLDVGCGPGKFCLIAASVADAHFTGIEQRADLVKAGHDATAKARVQNVDIIHGNVIDFSFSNYDAFYLYNPFEENVFKDQSIDRAIPLSADLYIKYIDYVARELRDKPLGTIVVTYTGSALEIPTCYDCQLWTFGNDLKLWVKVREAPNDEKELGFMRHCSRRTALSRTIAMLGERKCRAMRHRNSL